MHSSLASNREMEKGGEWKIRIGEYIGEVSALCYIHIPSHLSQFPCLLAGSGSQMLFYDLEAGHLIRSFHVFRGIRVHGIVSSFINQVQGPPFSVITFMIVVFGERRVKVFNLKVEINQRNEAHRKMCVNLNVLYLLPKFSKWVLDASFLKDSMTYIHKGRCFIAVGCSDNSVYIWDIQSSTVILEARCPERTLLYSMRLWGGELEALRIASGTIYNEIIVWKVHQNWATHLREQVDYCNHFDCHLHIRGNQYEAVHTHRLAGHEGSIFRIAWSSDGSKLLSVSDDRSARIWTVSFGSRSSKELLEASICESTGPVLFGHNARIWDCCIFDSLIVTAGEDCTCRVWDMDGKQLEMIKEHV